MSLMPLIFIMLKDLEIMLLIDLLEEHDLLTLHLFGWNLFIQISIMFTTMIYY